MLFFHFNSANLYSKTNIHQLPKKHAFSFSAHKSSLKLENFAKNQFKTGKIKTSNDMRTNRKGVWLLREEQKIHCHFWIKMITPNALFTSCLFSILASRLEFKESLDFSGRKQTSGTLELNVVNLVFIWKPKNLNAFLSSYFGKSVSKNVESL